MRGGHAHAPGGGCGWKNETGQSLDGAAGDQAHFRDDHRRQLREMGTILSGPANSDQSMGERDPLGNAAAFVSADNGVSLAGRPHGPRDGRGSARRSAVDP